MKCPVCYIARFPLLVGMFFCCLVWITHNAFAAFGRTFWKELCNVLDDALPDAKKALRGESFL